MPTLVGAHLATDFPTHAAAPWQTRLAAVAVHSKRACGVRSYCERLKQESFWGGEVEILVLSRMLKVPIYVFKTAEEAGRRARSVLTPPAVFVHGQTPCSNHLHACGSSTTAS